MNKAMWISDRRIYLDASGNAVEAKDPSRVSLLVCEGGSLPLNEAKRLGLVASEPEAAKAAEVAEDEAEVEPELEDETKAETEGENQAAQPESDQAAEPAKDKAVKPKRNQAKKPARNK